MKKRCSMLAVMVLLVATCQAQVGQDGPRVQQDGEKIPARQVVFANAGLAMVFPAALVPQPSQTPIILFAATLPQEPGLGVMLYAVSSENPDDAEASRKVAEGLVQAFSRQPNITDSKILTIEALQLGEKKGWMTTGLLTGEKGQESFALLVWEHTFEKPTLHMQYALEMHQGGTAVEQLAGLGRQIVSSAKNGPLVEPWQAPLPPLAVPVDLGRAGFTFRMPIGWFIARGGRVGRGGFTIAIGVGNYVGQYTPNVSITKQRPLDGDANYATTNGVTALIERRKLARSGSQWKLLQSRSTQLDGQRGVDLIASISVRGTQLVQAERCVIKDGTEYIIQVTYPLDQRPRAEQLLDQLGATFKFVQPQPQPSSE